MSTNADLFASVHFLNMHLNRLTKAIHNNDYASACASLRAISEEAENANRLAGTMSLQAHLKQPAQPRLTERGRT